jgi:hypothetical protein
MFKSSPRHAAARQQQISNHTQISQVCTECIEDISYLELDPHLDTSLVSANSHVIAYTDRVCEVAPCQPQYKAIQNVPIVKAGTIYVDQDTGIKHIS